MTPSTDEARAGEPRTEAGRPWAVHANGTSVHDARGYFVGSFPDAIAALIVAAVNEREAAAAPTLDMERLTHLRGTLALIASGRGPATEMASAALDVDDARLSEKAP